MSEWFLVCPNKGEFHGKCEFVQDETGFHLHCPKGLHVIKEPKGGDCNSPIVDH